MTTNQAQSNDEQRKKTNQIFNIAERPVMDFITKFLEDTSNVIFKDEIPTYTEPLILLPINEYKAGVCIKFTIKPINLSDEQPEQSLTIDSVINHAKVKEGIGFLWYCIKEVYTAVVATAMINNKPLTNTTMNLNEDNWTFYPKYVSEITSKKNFLESTLGKLMYIKQNIAKFPPEMVDEIINEFPKVTDQLKIVNAQITPEIIDIEKKINESYTKKPVLGIFIEEIFEKDLPKPILSKDDEISTKKNTILESNNDVETYDINQKLNNLFISE
jgi:hypothetical protein